jgi:hypothetical protein
MKSNDKGEIKLSQEILQFMHSPEKVFVLSDYDHRIVKVCPTEFDAEEKSVFSTVDVQKVIDPDCVKLDCSKVFGINNNYLNLYQYDDGELVIKQKITEGEN